MMANETKELKIKASDESMPAVNDFIHSMLPADCDEMLLNQIDLAVEEIFVNIAHYSGAEEAIRSPWLDAEPQDRYCYDGRRKGCSRSESR